MSRGLLELSPLRLLDPAIIDEKARQETRRREAILPPISVFRWWARRTDAVSGAIIEAVASEHNDERLLVADPFAGGGTIALAAIVRGHRVYAQELDPWAAHGIATMLALPPAADIESAANALHRLAQPVLSDAYETEIDGVEAQVSHTLRVPKAKCAQCDARQRLFPHALVTLLERKERSRGDAYLACRRGHLFVGSTDGPQNCPDCRVCVDPAEAYTTGREAQCWHCGRTASLAALSSTWEWEVALVERRFDGQRTISPPTRSEREAASDSSWTSAMALGAIPAGVETKALRRHGFVRMEQLYPTRQRFVLESLLRHIGEVDTSLEVKEVLRMAVVGSTEMAGYISRWDRWYLKSYEGMARHRFNLTTLAAEPNVWGVGLRGRGTVALRLRAMARAARWLDGRGVSRHGIDGPRIASLSPRPRLRTRDVARIVQGSSTRMLLPAATVDLVLTDPPYHDDIQYSELSLPLRAWAKLGVQPPAGQVVVNGSVTTDNYRVLLAKVFRECIRVLKPDGHLILSYANKNPEAWVALISALDAAGFEGCGYEYVHGENETDAAKQRGMHYSHNLLIDVVKRRDVRRRRWRALRDPSDPEKEFLRLAGEVVLRIGNLADSWADDLTQAMEESEFLSSPSALKGKHRRA